MEVEVIKVVEVIMVVGVVRVTRHKSQDSITIDVFFQLFTFEPSLHLCCLLEQEEVKKKQPKQSALYKQCIVLFSFPSCHITAQLYLLGCLFSIAKQKGLRGSIAFA